MFTLNKRVVATATCAAATMLISWGADQVRAERGAAPQDKRDEILATLLKVGADETGGSAEAGRPLYDERCAACHRFGAIGKDVGPDLTTITSRFKKKDVIESVLWPSRVISDQYQAEMFELTDGKIVSGLIVRETAAAVLVRTAETPEKPVAVPKAQIANRAPATASLMPEGLFETLTQKQMADLLAFVMAPPPDK
jgi:putative heme-binding domain-containing protein